MINKKEELKTNTRKIVGTNVERIRHKYETGCNFRHSDVEMKWLRKNPKIPNFKINSVHVEYRIVVGCGYTITDISL